VQALDRIPKEGISGQDHALRAFHEGVTHPVLVWAAWFSAACKSGKLGGSNDKKCQRQAGHPGVEANTLHASASAAEAGKGVVKRHVPLLLRSWLCRSEFFR